MTEHTTRRRAIVTGGGAGIGRATALRLARDGYAVCVLDVDTVAGRATAQQVGRRTTGHFLPCDVTRLDQAEQVVAEAVQLLGGLDLLVCAAHAECVAPVEQITEADWDRVTRTDLSGPAFLARAAAPALAVGGDGCIVLVSSIHARIGSGAHAAYSAAMAGLAALGRSLAAELAPDGVRCCTVSPYAALTESTRSRYTDPQWRELHESTVLSGRIMSADEVADVIRFTASSAGQVFNASDVAIDGGMSVFRERPAVSAYATSDGEAT